MERGVIFNAFKFHRLVGIAYSSGLNILRKLTAVLERKICEDGLELPSGLFLEVVSKRSRETPTRGHPRAEQLEIDKPAVATTGDNLELPSLDAPPGGASKSRASSTELSEGTYVASDSALNARKETLVLGLLSDRPLHFDYLYGQAKLSVGELSSALTILELDGEIVRLPGGFFLRTLAGGTNRTFDSPLQAATATSNKAENVSTVRSAVSFIRSTFKGISRKYLQNYLTAYSCYLDRQRWCVGAIMTVCSESGPIRMDEIREYVTPRMVKVFLCE
jgi:hypothetical protein